MPEDKQPFTEKELEALAREQGKPVRKGFENDVLKKIRFPQPENNRRKELEDLADSVEQDQPDQELS